MTRRLSEITHELATRGLAGEFGHSLVSLGVKIDDVIDTSGMSPDMRVAQAVRYMAEHAPIRVFPGELIVGSATLKEAPLHAVPMLDILNVGDTAIAYDRVFKTLSVSHTTLAFDRVLEVGYKGIRRQIDERLVRGGLDDKGIDMLHSMLLCLEGTQVWHQRYVDLLDRLCREEADQKLRDSYRDALETLRNVPENPAKSFREAVQSLWFAWSFLRLSGNWSGLGRMDQLLGPFLKRDVGEGRITLDEARELIAHFWVKGTEWVGAKTLYTEGGGGDAQFFQNVVLAGIDSEGREVTNEVTYLVLDVVEELHISDYSVAVRLNRNSPERLIRRMAEVQQRGGGIVSVYNEEVVIEALVKFGYPLEEARSFTNDGCWEAIIPGKTSFGYYPFDTLLLLQRALGLEDERAIEYPEFEDLYQAWIAELSLQLDRINMVADTHSLNGLPAPLVSIFLDDCIERGRGYNDRGPHYTVLASHAGGMPDTANSLFAIKKLVYDQKVVSLPELIDVLRSDWDGHDELRRMVRKQFDYYGNDSDEADGMVGRVFDDYTRLVGMVPERCGVLRPAGISTFGREIEWRQHRKATADGHKAGDILATNFSPSPGTDKLGPTAALRSYCKADFTKLPNIGTLELKLVPGCVSGEGGVEAIAALLKTFVALGGCYLSIDVVDSEMLRDAQLHPDRYASLAVRVSGWSARFNTLGKNWQDMIIQRTEQEM